MNRILLADDSPHAQRMGERILRDEGFEVVSVTDGETALLRLADVDPEVIIADVFLPGRSGLDICRYVRNQAIHQHVRIVITAGMLESFDEQEVRAAGANAILKKPFEASVMLETIKPLMVEAQLARTMTSQVESTESPRRHGLEPPVPAAQSDLPSIAAPEAQVSSLAQPEPRRVTAGTGVSEEELVRAAVTVALDAAFPALVEDITLNVLRNLKDVGNGAQIQEYEPPADIALPVPRLITDNS
jgi:CheY-like chemotaxis protein